ncbi:hypothetical protein [Thermogemmatispora onikobensis]|uniref:hypothetical protein n=1 Tax=Thermogemmatispora onikobensis TaxID=732234 RepID=UPI000853607F|nr:hypothetical protein [Thermogemmatispora onikobensis]
MTRDADQRPANPRRQRPLLVVSSSSSTAAEQRSDQRAEGGTQQVSARAEEQASSASARAGSAAKAASARRQPGFFASVTQTADGQGQAEQPQRSPADAGKMRLWRALRLYRGASSEGDSGSAERASKKAGEAATKGQQQKVVRNMTKTQASSTTARSSGQAAGGSADQASRPLLKSRHFLGLFIYVFAATLLQIPLAYLSPVLHLNEVLFQFSIGNFPVVITHALVIYLVLLVGLLLVLNRFDLFPSFGRTAEERRRGASQGSSSRSKASAGKKEAGKGEHDHLYEDYRDLRRYLRRRARKR